MSPRSAALGQGYSPPGEEANLNRVEAIIRAQYERDNPPGHRPA
jgi:hypothetical protein